MIPYATLDGYRQIEALIANRYVWSESGGCWLGGEEDACADGIADLEGWNEAVNADWIGGRRIAGFAGRETAEEITQIEVEDGRPKAKRRKSSFGTPAEEIAATVKGSLKGKSKGKAKG